MNLGKFLLIFLVFAVFSLSVLAYDPDNFKELLQRGVDEPTLVFSALSEAEFRDLVRLYFQTLLNEDINTGGVGKYSGRNYDDTLEKFEEVIGDCNVDEVRTCGFNNLGVCALGVQTCQNRLIWGKCVGAVWPSAETCDLRDNDCDGLIDENLERSTNELGECSVNTESCVAGEYLPNNEYVSIIENTCDNDAVDNDCDGSDAPYCITDSVLLSSSPSLLNSDGVETSVITAVISDNKKGIVVSFAGGLGNTYTFSSTTCATAIDGTCSITIASSTSADVTVTGSATNYFSGETSIAFSKKPVALPVTFTGSDVIDSEIILECAVSDSDDYDNPVGEKLGVKVWVGECDADDCFNTRTWLPGFDGVLMDVPVSGSKFTKDFVIRQDVGQGIAVTCRAFDSKGLGGTWGDAYPLITVGCPVAPPSFSSITAVPNPAGAETITITFTSSAALGTRPSVTLKNTASDVVLGNAKFLSNNNLDYTYSFPIPDSSVNGPTDIIVSGQTTAHVCSQGSSIGTFNIDICTPSTEICDGIDNNCDLIVDEGCPVTVMCDGLNLFGGDARYMPFSQVQATCDEWCGGNSFAVCGEYAASFPGSCTGGSGGIDWDICESDYSGLDSGSSCEVDMCFLGTDVFGIDGHFASCTCLT